MDERQQILFDYPPFREFLPDAISPDTFSFWPEEGYRVEVADRTHRVVAAISKEKIFDIFMVLIEQFPDELDVVLLNYHGKKHDEVPLRLWATEKDPIVVKSALCDYEDMLLENGNVGVAILNSRNHEDTELRLDDNKLLYAFRKPTASQRILEQEGIRRKNSLSVIEDVEHFHITWGTDGGLSQFASLAATLGAEEERSRYELDGEGGDDEADWSTA